MPDQIPPTDPVPKIQRAYRALLRVLPFEFRAEYGRDMEEAFAEERDDVRARHSHGETLGFWFRTAGDFMRTAPRQHWDFLKQDVRVGARLLARNPGFAAAAILTIALGIGGSTSIFSIVHAVVLRPLAFPESERVVSIGWVNEREDAMTAMRGASPADLEMLRDRPQVFETVGAMRYDSLSSEKGPLRVPVPGSASIGGVGESSVVPQMASAAIFRIFGASTVLGRLPDEQDERTGAAPVVVLSYGTWTSHYAKDPGIVGRTLVRNLGAGRRQMVTIVGVLAPGAFEYPYLSSRAVPAWASLDPDVLRVRDDKGREIFNLAVFARLAPRTSLDSARAEVGSLTPHLAPGLPDYLASNNASLQPARLRDLIVGRGRAPLLAFLGAVSCLLLLAAGNVGSLVLARAVSRRQEFAARFALGARPLRVARQLITESALLGISGGVLGLGLAWAGRRAFVAISPSMPRLEDSGIGAPAVAFALGGILLATCVAGLVPALQSSRRSVADGLRRAGGASGTATPFSRPLAVLAAIEVGLVLVLLAGTGLLVNSFARLVRFDLGFDSRSIFMVTLERTIKPSTLPLGPASGTQSQPATAVLSDRQRRLRMIDDELIQRLSAIAGVSATGLTGDDPFGPPYRYGVDVQIGEPSRVATPALRLASPTAFEALRMRMASGRWFTSSDGEGTPLVAVVNESMARRFWPGHSPIGDRMVYGRRTFQIVGIVADVRDRGAREDARATFYVSTIQIPPDPVMAVVRTEPGFKGVDQAITAELTQMGDRIAAHSPRRLEDIWWRQLADARFLTMVLSVFTVVGLAVALVGVYGVLRLLVAQRTREMGIRKALGATRFDLVALVVGQALRFAIPGCVVGLLAAAAAGPALRSLLFGITPTDPLTLVSATVFLIAAVILSAFLPARRASAVDPALSLRTE